MSEFAWYQVHTQIYTDLYLYCLFSVCQPGCGRSVNPTVFSTQMPYLLSAASLSISNSLDFNVFLYRAGKGPHKSFGHEKNLLSLQSEISSSFSQHPIAGGSAEGRFSHQQGCTGGKWGLWNCLQVTATLMPLSDPNLGD